MRLSVNVVHGGKYVRAGDDLPSDFILPEHLERFAVYDEPSQASRVDLRFPFVEGQSGVGTRLAKPAMNYDEGEEEFAPKVKSTKWNQLRHAPKKKGK